jgi:transcriptional regulator with XRE-family HTH domain
VNKPFPQERPCNDSIPEIIKELDRIRISKGIISNELSKTLGFSPQWWSHRRKGYVKLSSLAGLEKVAEFLGYRVMLVPLDPEKKKPIDN